MLTHLVCFEFHAGKDDLVDGFAEALRALPARIPAIRELRAGRNTSSRGGGFHVGLSVTFDSPEDLETYRHHPAHVDFVTFWVEPHVKRAVAVDFT